MKSGASLRRPGSYYWYIRRTLLALEKARIHREPPRKYYHVCVCMFLLHVAPITTLRTSDSNQLEKKEKKRKNRIEKKITRKATGKGKEKDKKKRKQGKERKNTHTQY